MIRKKAEKYYDFISKDVLSDQEYQDNLSKYPILENENIYVLNTTDTETIASMEDSFATAIIAVTGIENSDPADLIKEMQDSMPSPNPEQMMSSQTQPQQMTIETTDDIFNVLAMMPQDTLDEIRGQMEEKMGDVEDSIKTSMAISYVKDEYEAVGIDVAAKQTNYIISTGAIMLAIALAGVVASVIVSYIAARTAAGFGRDVRRSLFVKVTSFSNNEIDKFSTASLITRTTNDIQQIQLLLVMLLRIVFYAPILAIGGSIRAIEFGGSMVWIIAMAVGIIVVAIGILFGFVTPRFKRIQRLVDKINLVLRQSLEGMPVIRAFNTQKHEEEKFDVQNRRLLKDGLFVNRGMALLMPIMMLVMNGVMLVIIWVGASQIDAGLLQVGDMMAVIQYAMQIIMAFLMISMVAIMMPRASVAAKRINEVLKTDLSIHDPKEPKQFKENNNDLEFKNVTFAYPGAELPVLEDISFTAKAGETTAFIGSTGSGKSTMMNLIPRFYDVTDGQIMIGGLDIREVTQHDLREKIGFITQKAVLFSGTVDSNIRYANEGASDEEIAHAAEIAQAMEFIQEKNEKFDTPIAEGGTNVSGGQKQRLSIARAILKNPKIFVFDDTFSALDYTTDAKLRRALKAETQNSAVLIVAQRIGTIMNAEQIIVLDNGKIVGKGTHKELLRTCSVYREIAESQMSEEELQS